MIKRRHPALVFIFTIITLGIYGIYWMVKTKTEINSLGADIPTAWLLIIPIANLYFLYKYMEGFATYVDKGTSKWVWFILWLFASIIIMVIVQMKLNKFAK
ncbi:hypothetical protein CL614_02365 [archaeon]|nr:hypothetical protein [archaeon]